MFPLSCAGARPRSNWNSPAYTELLPHRWNFLNFHCKYYYAYYKQIVKCHAVVRSCKNLMLIAAAGPSSCKKIRGKTAHKIQTSMLPEGFEPAIPASQQRQIRAFDRTATGIGYTLYNWSLTNSYTAMHCPVSRHNCGGCGYQLWMSTDKAVAAKGQWFSPRMTQFQETFLYWLVRHHGDKTDLQTTFLSEIIQYLARNPFTSYLLITQTTYEKLLHSLQ
jgi:hypothetical protein